jgi:hypothetical protein
MGIDYFEDNAPSRRTISCRSQIYADMRSSIVSIVLMVLGMCIIAPNVSATDYSTSETLTEKKLLDPANNLGIVSADVSIDTQQVTINCITQLTIQETGAPIESFTTFLGGVLTTYYSIVSAAPDVGYLLIIVKNENQPNVATFSCPKSWINDLDPTNKDAVQELIFKVLATYDPYH